MAGTTPHYGLQKLNSGDSFSLNGYKYTDADRDRIDQLLYSGGEGHSHTGTSAASVVATPGPVLQLDQTQGALKAGTRVYYKYTYVDANGNQTAGSPEAFYDIPAGIADPAAPTLTTATTGGTLTPGSYYYVLSAYVGTTTKETKATNVATITVPTGTNTNRITVTFPALPSGATGFNVYRRSPAGSSYLWITSSTATSISDTGLAEDCNRTLPTANTTYSTNAITVTLPGSPPAVPAGYTWKLYRSLTTGVYNNALVVSGLTATSYLDLGAATTSGTPPTTSQLIGTPAKIQLTNAANIQGFAPLGSIAGFPFFVTFNLEGLLSVQTGSFVWPCPFPNAYIVSVQASLGIGYKPAGTPVILDVNRGPSGTNPVFTTIFTTQANRPQIAVNAQVGVAATPAVRELVRGDCLSIDVDQAGGGTTPTDRDLVVVVYMLAYGFGLTSHPWAAGVTPPAGEGL